MKAKYKIILIRFFVTFVTTSIFAALAIPRYYSLQNDNLANQCKFNQIIVETTLAVAHAESLMTGKDIFPKKLSVFMFDTKTIPTCPIDNTPIKFDSTTGKAFCPNHISSHQR